MIEQSRRRYASVASCAETDPKKRFKPTPPNDCNDCQNHSDFTCWDCIDQYNLTPEEIAIYQRRQSRKVTQQ